MLQNEMEHLKTKLEIKHNSQKKEIDALTEQLNLQRKRNTEFDKTLDKERKIFQEQRCVDQHDQLHQPTHHYRQEFLFYQKFTRSC